jgi:S-methylmethionine-dependent homocysteine/selenocysteine methylase
MTFRGRLAGTRAVVLDGATGTELQRRGVDTGLPLWSARALSSEAGRDVLKAIHADYARAGAEVLTTNTFRTTQRALGRAGVQDRWVLFNRRAVEAARAGAASSGEAPDAAPRTIFVAGSIAPLEDCYSCDLVPPQADCLREHLQQVDLLAHLGVDLILIETMNTYREARAAVLAVRAAGIDALLSLCPGDPDRLLSGEPLDHAIPRLLEASKGRVVGLLLNCATPEVLARAAPVLARLAGSLPWGLYAHLGERDPVTGWRLPERHEAQAYAAWVRDRLDEGARLVGGCCGTMPDHIAALESVVPGA